MEHHDDVGLLASSLAQFPATVLDLSRQDPKRITLGRLAASFTQLQKAIIHGRLVYGICCYSTTYEYVTSKRKAAANDKTFLTLANHALSRVFGCDGIRDSYGPT